MPPSTTRRRSPSRTSLADRTSSATRAETLRWLKQLTAIPTAAGREDRVIAWVEAWVAKRRGLSLERDRAGNLLIRPRNTGRAASRSSRPADILVTAHLDHPAFVALDEVKQGRLGDLDLELDLDLEGDGDAGTLPTKLASRRGRFMLCEFRGGVHRPYFDGAHVEFFPEGSNRAVSGEILATSEAATPHRRAIVAFDGRAADRLAAGDIGRWRFDGPAAGRLPRVEDGLLFTHACDDLAAVAAALAMLDRTHRRKDLRHVGVLLTRAEEVGFIGAIAAARSREIPKATRLLCLENSRSFPESPIGGGPIVRVGDRLSVFSPELTNAVSAAATAHAKAQTEAGRTFPWQRKLMAGGACEATAFASYGRPSTCLCLPLGHYHNMSRIDEVVAGERPAKVAPEFIAVEDYHGLVDLLEAVVERIDETDEGSGRALMERLHRERSGVLG